MIWWAAFAAHAGYIGPASPPWAASYAMKASTISMALNASGLSSPVLGGAFGIISYDWSNAKSVWAKQEPMDSEGMLLTQATMTKAANPATKVFVYRNLVKALPWFSSVRAKLDDPRYSGWFIPFGGGDSHVPACAAENHSKCSTLYHDQEQTPQVPTDDDPSPDGSCANQCDCGVQPCGEYLFDHRNASLRAWLVDEMARTVSNASVDGLFIDDYWCSDLLCNETSGLQGCPCSDPVQGPTEVDQYWQLDTGLDDDQVRQLTLAWNETMGAAQQAILDAGAYTWSLIDGQENANAAPALLDKLTCRDQLQDACAGQATAWQLFPHLFGLAVDGNELLQPDQDVAFFLLARGDYAWIGYGVWGMTWPPSMDLPSFFDADFGVPTEFCYQDETSGVFHRNYTKASVALDCDLFEASIEMVPPAARIPPRLPETQ